MSLVLQKSLVEKLKPSLEAAKFEVDAFDAAVDAIGSVTILRDFLKVSSKHPKSNFQYFESKNAYDIKVKNICKNVNRYVRLVRNAINSIELIEKLPLRCYYLEKLYAASSEMVEGLLNKECTEISDMLNNQFKECHLNPIPDETNEKIIEISKLVYDKLQLHKVSPRNELNYFLEQLYKVYKCSEFSRLLVDEKTTIEFLTDYSRELDQIEKNTDSEIFEVIALSLRCLKEFFAVLSLRTKEGDRYMQGECGRLIASLVYPDSTIPTVEEELEAFLITHLEVSQCIELNLNGYPISCIFLKCLNSAIINGSLRDISLKLKNCYLNDTYLHNLFKGFERNPFIECDFSGSSITILGFKNLVTTLHPDFVNEHLIVDSTVRKKSLLFESKIKN